MANQTRAAERWSKLTAEALARDGHRCRLALPGCGGSASAVVVEPDSRREPARLEQLVSACPACIERLNPELTPEQLLAEELEDMADERLILHVIDPVTGEVLATDRTSNTRRSFARAKVEPKPAVDEDEGDDDEP